MCIYRQTTITIFFFLIVTFISTVSTFMCFFYLCFFRATILFVFGLLNVTEIGI